MANLGKVVYLSDAQYSELVANGSITVDGVTVVYNENDIYMTPQTAPVTSVNGQTGAVMIETTAPPKVASITLSATWSGSDPYTQTVTISGYTVTANSKIDLQPDATALAQMIDDGTSALWIENNNGTLTAYALGAGTSVALTVQCTITEVET